MEKFIAVMLAWIIIMVFVGGLSFLIFMIADWAIDDNVTLLSIVKSRITHIKKLFKRIY